MKKERLIWQMLVGCLVIMALLLSACRPTAVPTEAPQPTKVAAPTEAPKPTEVAAPTEAPKPTEAPTQPPPPAENIITYAYPRTINELDPSLVLSSENNIMWNVYGTLTFWDKDKGVLPYLAESWESNEDKTQWTFHLREGMKCHDGTDFTAEDVKFSYERTIAKGSLAYVFASLDSVEVVDPLTVRLNLKYPFRWDANAANSWGAYLMCDSAADKESDWYAAGNDSGAGPYKIESWEPGQRMVLTEFEGWTGGWPENHFNKVVIEIVEDAAVRVQKLRGGEADIAWGIPYDDFESLNATGRVTAMAVPAYLQLQWHLNTRRAPLNDLRVRQALAYAFPYEEVQKGTYGGFATVSKGAVPRIMWQPPVETKIYTYDLEKARQLLKEAGVPEGTKIKLAVETALRDAIQMAQLWQAELAKIGIDLQIEQVSASVRWDEVYNPETEFDIMIMTMVIGFDSPNEYLGSLWHSKWTWFPFSGFASPEFDALVEKALSEEAVDKAASDADYQKAEQILFDNAVAIFALDLPQDFAVANDIEGFKVNPLYGYDVFFWQLGRKTQ